MRRAFSVAWILASALLLCCDLNPQPFPPNPKNSAVASPPTIGGGNTDAGSNGLPNVAQDSGNELGSNEGDAASRGGGDAGMSPALDAASDAREDAASAVEDASIDATAADAPAEADALGATDGPAESSELDAAADAGLDQ
jgi:hypothetical protein